MCAIDAGTGVGDTGTIFACFVGFALDFGTRWDALSVPAECVGVTRHTCTWVSGAGAFLAPFSAGAAEVITVVGDTLAIFAGLSRGAIDVFARVDALAILTGQRTGALDGDTWVRLTFSHATDSAVGAFDCFTWIFLAASLVTDVSTVARHTCAWVFDTFAIATGFAFLAGHILARGDAFAIATELIGGTLE